MAKCASVVISVALLCLTTLGVGDTFAVVEIKSIYQQHCSECHHGSRLGLTAPPLVPMFLEKRTRQYLNDVITDGSPATQMPAFGYTLTPGQIDALVSYILSPSPKNTWTEADINASRNVYDYDHQVKIDKLDETTLVVEKGTKSLAALNGGSRKVLSKFYVGAVHGGPKFSPNLQEVYSVARDGLITRIDMSALAVVGRVKAGINTRSLAISSDGQSIAVANYLPSNIVIFDRSLNINKRINLTGRAGGFYSLPKSHKFILTYRDLDELWLINDEAPYSIEKHKLPAQFEDISISPVGTLIVGTKRGSDKLYYYDYAKKKVIATFPSSGMPHLASAAFFRIGNSLHMAINHIQRPALTIINMDTLKKVKDINIPGAGFFVRSHKASPWLWVDTMTDSFTLVSKKDFLARNTLTPRAGKKSMHVEFSTDGKIAMITMPQSDGEVIFYDSVTLKELGSTPFNKPMGKYNAINKTFPKRMIEPSDYDLKLSEGRKVFDEYCMGCHHQTIEAFAPPFNSIAESRSVGEIKMQIVAPTSGARHLGYSKSSMSRIKLTKRQLNSIVAYIKSFEGVK